ncbi:MAG: hypothetical protein ACK463_09335, partial [Bradyrhizobium sp.]
MRDRLAHHAKRFLDHSLDDCYPRLVNLSSMVRATTAANSASLPASGRRSSSYFQVHRERALVLRWPGILNDLRENVATVRLATRHHKLRSDSRGGANPGWLLAVYLWFHPIGSSPAFYPSP